MTPELQYPAEDTLRAVTPPINSSDNALQLYLEDSPQGPLSHLLTLANVATLQRPTSISPDTDGILIASPVALRYPDPLHVNQSQEEEAPSEHTFGSRLHFTSPSYHICTPTP